MTRFVLLLILLAASQAKAQIPQTSNLTGNWLYTVCSASDQKGQVICQMWISGFQAGIISSQKLAQVNKLKPASCIPYDVTADQTKLIIEKFLKDNPQYVQLSAEMVASYALVIAFPRRYDVSAEVWLILQFSLRTHNGYARIVPFHDDWIALSALYRVPVALFHIFRPMEIMSC